MPEESTCFEKKKKKYEGFKLEPYTDAQASTKAFHRWLESKPSNSKGLSGSPCCFDTLWGVQVSVLCYFLFLSLLVPTLHNGSITVPLGGKTHFFGHSATPTQLFSFWTELVHANARPELGLSKCLTGHTFPRRHSLLLTCSMAGMMGKD